jgi:hypothetical protein
MRTSVSKLRKVTEPAVPGTPSTHAQLPPSLEGVTIEKVVWATQKLQTRLRKIIETWRHRGIRRSEVVWRAGLEWVRGMCYATIAAGQLVADGVLEWTSMDSM